MAHSSSGVDIMTHPAAGRNFLENIFHWWRRSFFLLMNSILAFSILHAEIIENIFHPL